MVPANKEKNRKPTRNCCARWSRTNRRRNEGGEYFESESMVLFEVAHALLTEHSDDRAEIHSVVVDDVVIDPEYSTEVQVDLTTSWSFYTGCRDMNATGDEYDSAIATYTTVG
jgi:hypothetical protein